MSIPGLDIGIRRGQKEYPCPYLLYPDKEAGAQGEGTVFIEGTARAELIAEWSS